MVPTFSPSKDKVEKLVPVEDEKPEEDEVKDTERKDFFIFLVDRSGSMGGQKMEITKQALKLFLKSLPPNSKFDIISFGSRFESLCQDKRGFEYS